MTVRYTAGNYSIRITSNKDGVYKALLLDHEGIGPKYFYGDTEEEVINDFKDWVYFNEISDEDKSAEENCSNINKIKIIRINEDAKLPTYGSKGAAGMDFYSISEIKLYPNIPTLCETGLKMQIPKGMELQIRPRSGLAYTDGITVLNTPGTIDEDYRGEIGIILIWNGFDYTSDNGIPRERKFAVEYYKTDFSASSISTCDYYHNTNINTTSYITIPKGYRIAQGVLTNVYKAKFEEVEEIDITERGDNGFGSTGVK